MRIDKSDTAVVVIDPQNDVLSEKGVSWSLSGTASGRNNTVENLARLFRAAKEGGFAVFISPHYLYPTDQAWLFAGPVENDAGEQGVRASGALRLTHSPVRERTGWSASSRSSMTARRSWPSPHKVSTPETNDLVFNCANGASTRSFWRGCWRTSASRAICATFWRRGSRSPSSRTLRLVRVIRSWATIQGGVGQFRVSGERSPIDGRRLGRHEVGGWSVSICPCASWSGRRGGPGLGKLPGRRFHRASIRFSLKDPKRPSPPFRRCSTRRCGRAALSRRARKKEAAHGSRAVAASKNPGEERPTDGRPCPRPRQ